MSSLSKVIVTKISNLKKHPDADLLLIGEFDGMSFIVNKNDTCEGDLRCIVPFDMICPNEEWVGEFIRGQRVKPMRLRGIFSMAVCLPLPQGFEAYEGEDVTEKLGFTKWIPPEERDDYPDGVQLNNSFSGNSCSAPSGLVLSKYDLESLRKYHGEFSFGEPVIITEKLEGENISIVYWEDKLHVKSRNRWIVEGDNKWWAAVLQYDWSWLKDNPGLVAIGEKYGNVNKFRYDCVNGEQRIRLFDVYDSVNGRFLNWDSFTTDLKKYIDPVPVLYKGPWLGLDQHKELAEGQSTIGNHIKEGFVVQPVIERQTNKFERVKFKLHGESYLIAKGKLK